MDRESSDYFSTPKMSRSSTLVSTGQISITHGTVRADFSLPQFVKLYANGYSNAEVPGETRVRRAD